MNDRRTALVLSGGGAYGAYEVGVMKALCAGESSATGYQALDSGIFSGTSVGAFNAAMMTMQPEAPLTAALDRLEKIWINEISAPNPQSPNGVYRFRGNPLTYLNPETFLEKPGSQVFDFAGDAAHFAKYCLDHVPALVLSSAGPIRRAVRLIDFSALISVDPFNVLIERSADFESIRKSTRVLRISATNWEAGTVRVFANEDMADDLGSRILQASAAIPGLFPVVQVGGDVYVDGGVLVNTPLHSAIKAGATTLHVIYLDPDLKTIPLQRLQNTLDTFDRVYTIMQATKVNEDIETVAWVNGGIEAMRRIAETDLVSDEDAKLFVRVAGQVERHIRSNQPYQKLTIHRYHPHDDLGGAFGMFDFDRTTVARMIERGFEDAVRHDCKASQCILAN